MYRGALIASLLLTCAVAFAATFSAHTSSIEGNVLGNGRPLKDAEIRFEQKGKQISLIISRTDVNGHYTSALPRGIYKMSLTTRRHTKNLHHGESDWSEFTDRLRSTSVGGETEATYLAIGTKPESEQLHHLVLAKPLQFFSSVPAPAPWRIIPALIRAKAQRS